MEGPLHKEGEHTICEDYATSIMLKRVIGIYRHQLLFRRPRTSKHSPSLANTALLKVVQKFADCSHLMWGAARQPKIFFSPGEENSSLGSFLGCVGLICSHEKKYTDSHALLSCLSYFKTSKFATPQAETLQVDRLFFCLVVCSF